MFSSTELYQVLLAIIIISFIIFGLACLCWPKVKRGKKLFLLITATGIAAIRLFVVNPVYLIQDNNEVVKRYLLFPTQIQMKNYTHFPLKPEVGLSSVWIVNDGSLPGIYEMIPYGDGNNHFYRIQISPFSINQVPRLDYFFQPPPTKLKSNFLVSYQSWFYR